MAMIKMNVCALGCCADTCSILMLICIVEWDYLMQSDVERILHIDCDNSLSLFVEQLRICLLLKESLFHCLRHPRKSHSVKGPCVLLLLSSRCPGGRLLAGWESTSFWTSTYLWATISSLMQKVSLSTSLTLPWQYITKAVLLYLAPKLSGVSL